MLYVHILKLVVLQMAKVALISMHLVAVIKALNNNAVDLWVITKVFIVGTI